MEGILVSALTGEGSRPLGEAVEREFRRTLRSGELLCPTPRVPVWPSYTRSPAAWSAPTDTPEGARVRVLLPAPVARRFERFDAVDV